MGMTTAIPTPKNTATTPPTNLFLIGTIRRMASSSPTPTPRWRSYMRLTKPGIVRMVMITAAFGFLMASGGIPGLARLPLAILALLGIGSAAAGSAVLNNVLERDLDARMERTRFREIPSGIIDPAAALAFGLALVLFGVGLLLAAVNLITAFLTLLSAFLYVAVYTPMKRMHWVNTSIGAIPGALPMACGWVAATGHLDLGAWIAFAILYAWQHPHFYAIAWMYREDYAKAGFKMLSVLDDGGTRLVIHTVLHAILLIAVSIAPTMFGRTGLIYLIGAGLLGIAMLAASLVFVYDLNRANARRLLFTSLIYLPAMLVVLAVDFAV